MTIRIENALNTPDRYKNQDSFFLKPGFRNALAKEYKLKAVDLGFDHADQTRWLPAYKKQSFSSKTLVIGAGFDKTGEVSRASPVDFSSQIETLIHQLDAHQIKQLELRTKHAIPCQQNHSDKVELAIQLETSCAERMKQFSKSTRRNLRLPFKHGFHYEIGKQARLLKDFYQLYLLSMHHLGSLPHSWRFFNELWQECQDDILIFVGYMDERPVAASLYFLTVDEAYGAWGCAHPDYGKYSVFISMLWSMLEHCEQNGRRCLNLGRTSINSNAYHFKKRLANQEQPIYHYTLHAHPSLSTRSSVYDAASWLIRHTPPQFMHTLSRSLLHRFY